MTMVFVWPDNSFVLAEDYEDVNEQWRGDDFRRLYIPDNVPFEDIPQYIEDEAEAAEESAAAWEVARRAEEEEAAPRWRWMMDYCKRHGLAPANHKVWEEAELAFQRSQSKGEAS